MSVKSKQSKAKRVPKLRFPGFSSEWEEKTIGEVFNNFGGTSLEKFVDVHGNYKFISIGNYSKDGKYIDNGQRIVLDNKTKAKLLNENDLVMILNDKTTSGAIIGSTILIDKSDEYIYNQRTERLVCKKMIFPLFAWYYLNSKKFRKKVFSLAQGGTQIYINFPFVKKLDFPFPSFPEQQKISTFLNTVDDWINNLKKQKESFELYKKGMMQKIFSQEVRFKDDDGKDFSDWEERILSEVADIRKGEQLNRIELSLNKDYPVINGGVEPSGYTDNFNTRRDTITISEGGNSCGYVNFIKEDFWSGGHCYSLLNLRNNIELLFLYQYLKYSENIIKRLRVGSGLPNIQKKDIEKLKFDLPSFLEQQKIAEFLTSIDNLIESKRKQINQSEEWKKGLIQVLFI